jgi:hypothetical protein
MVSAHTPYFCTRSLTVFVIFCLYDNTCEQGELYSVSMSTADDMNAYEGPFGQYPVSLRFAHIYTLGHILDFLVGLLEGNLYITSMSTAGVINAYWGTAAAV